MAYTDVEYSSRSGQPIEFLKFEIPGVISWRHTSADAIVSYLGQEYEPLSTLRGEPRYGQNAEDVKIGLEIPLDHPLIELFKTQPPFQRIFVYYFRKHVSDAEVKSYYQGFIGGVKFKEDTCEVHVSSFEALLERSSPPDMWQPNCRYFLFNGEKKGGKGCPVPSAAYERTGVITYQSGDELQSTMFSAETPGWFTLGFVQSPSGRRSMILEHSGSIVRILAPYQEDLIGATISAYPGCDGLLSTCQGKFGAHTDNGERHGGKPRIPRENPSEKGIR